MQLQTASYRSYTQTADSLRVSSPPHNKKTPGGRLVQGKGTRLSCGRMGPLILNFGTTWGVVVSFTPLPPYP